MTDWHRSIRFREDQETIGQELYYRDDIAAPQDIEQVLVLLKAIATKASRMSFDDLSLFLRTDGWPQEHALTPEFPD